MVLDQVPCVARSARPVGPFASVGADPRVALDEEHPVLRPGVGDRYRLVLLNPSTVLLHPSTTAP